MIKNSAVVETRVVEKSFFTDYQVRRRPKQHKLQFLGFTGDAIKDMTREQFEKFQQYKQKFEKQVTGDYKIIVTTCGCAANKLIRELNIKTVVIDEAT